MHPSQTIQLIDLLREVNGSTFISIDTCTHAPTYAKLPGTQIPNPHHNALTRFRHGINVIAFQNKNVNGYEQMIRRRLQQEGKDPESFVLSPRKWGTRLPNMPVVEYNGEYYLEVIYINEGKTTWQCDGHDINGVDVMGVRPWPDSNQGGLDNKVIIRAYSFDSLRRIKINKQVHNIIQDAMAKNEKKVDDMNRTLGMWITSSAGRYFVTKQAQALAIHRHLIDEMNEMGSYKVTSKGVTIERALQHSDCPPFVVLEDMDRGEVYALRWSPMSPHPLECDHNMKVRFKVLDFAENAAEADQVVSILRNQRRT